MGENKIKNVIKYEMGGESLDDIVAEVKAEIAGKESDGEELAEGFDGKKLSKEIDGEKADGKELSKEIDGKKLSKEIDGEKAAEESIGNKSGGKKKQIPLRLSPELYSELARWADDEFRSVNGQIEFLLTECVKKRK
jgi:hypothetical protein